MVDTEALLYPEAQYIDSSEKIVEIDPNALTNHPQNKKFFHDITGDEWDSFVEDIHKNGIRIPLIVWEKNEREGPKSRTVYIIISGHQRTRAALELNLPSVKAILRHYETEEEALEDLLRINYINRTLTPEEKLRRMVYLYEKLKTPESDEFRPAGRTKGDTRDFIAKEAGTHKDNADLANYITTLPPERQEEYFRSAAQGITFKELRERALNEKREKNALKKENKELKANLKDWKKVKDKEKAIAEVEALAQSKGVASGAAAELISIMGGLNQATEQLTVWARKTALNPKEVRDLEHINSIIMHNLDACKQSLQKTFTEISYEG